MKIASGIINRRNSNFGKSINHNKRIYHKVSRSIGDYYNTCKQRPQSKKFCNTNTRRVNQVKLCSSLISEKIPNKALLNFSYSSQFPTKYERETYNRDHKNLVKEIINSLNIISCITKINTPQIELEPYKKTNLYKLKKNIVAKERNKSVIGTLRLNINPYVGYVQSNMHNHSSMLFRSQQIIKNHFKQKAVIKIPTLKMYTIDNLTDN